MVKEYVDECKKTTDEIKIKDIQLTEYKAENKKLNDALTSYE